MSDLAPFVAAVIRDRVVEDLQNENEAQRQEIERLRRTLHERNPRRSVQLTGPNGKKVFVDSSLHLSTAQHFWTTQFTFMNRGTLQQRGREHEAVIVLCARNLPKCEVWIDGGRALCLKDLSYHYVAYGYNNIQDEWHYVAMFYLRDAVHFNLQVSILLPPNDHAKLLN